VLHQNVRNPEEVSLAHFNFTDRVRHGLLFARDEAHLLRHDYVGPEHMLLGVLRIGGRGVAALEALPISVPDLRAAVLSRLTHNRSAMTASELPYTSRAKKAMELAMIEARELGYTYVGTEHLLLGLLREESGIAAQTLLAAGVTPAILRAEVVRRRDIPADAPAASAPSAPSRLVAVTVLFEHADGRLVAMKFADTSSAISFLAGSAGG
jgi:ATP-dependent Clp protease ATP-binding subunit ClpC